MARRRSLPLAVLTAGTCLALPGTVSPCGPMYYAAAPLLAAFPERHPVKTMLDLFAETQAEAKPAIDTPVSLFVLLPQYLTKPKAEALQAIDAALVENRSSGAYAARIANLLWDLRDLRVQAEEPLSEEANVYVTWRVELAGREKVGLPPSVALEQQKLEDAWWSTPEKRAADVKQLADRQAALKVEIEEGEKAIASASPLLAPHWMVARGGAAFRRGALEEASKWFSAVNHHHQDHPRRETALYMLARTRIEEARRLARAGAKTGEGGERGLHLGSALEEAGHLLEEYAKTYPKGRYIAEVPGWQGAMHTLSGSHWLALASYARQLEQTAHPEVRASAGREIERCFKELMTSDTWREGRHDAEESMKQLARHPLAAARVMGYLLDGPVDLAYEWRAWDDGEGDAKSDTLDRLKAMLGRSRHAELLAFLASCVVQQDEPSPSSPWPPKVLAILAWAATENGEHLQALRLCERDRGMLAKSDDLQYCRAVTLQRLGEDARAVQAMQDLRSGFPQSRLSSSLALRLGQSLHRLGRDGQAIVALNQAVTQQVNEARENPEWEGKRSPLHTVEELGQFLDVLEQFSPVSQLELALRSPELGKDAASRLHRVTSGRLLAAEDWAGLRRVLGQRPAGPATPEEDQATVFESDFNYLRWSEALASYRPGDSAYADLAHAVLLLHEPLAHAVAGEGKAAWSWALASFWEVNRGRLSATTINVGFSDYMASDFRQIELRLRTNALALGFSAEVINRELDSRDEQRHAFDHCLRAADAAPGTPLAAMALHKALECLRRMAEVSPYAQSRAFEADWSGLSQRLHQRLMKECPDSSEAKMLSAWWTFAAPRELHGWMPGNEHPPIEDDQIREHLVLAPNGLSREHWGESAWERESARTRQLGQLRGRMDALGAKVASQGIEAALQECAAIRKELVPLADLLDWNSVMSALDEAELVLGQPAPDLERVKRYFLNPQASPENADEYADFRAYHAREEQDEDLRHGGTWWGVEEARWQKFLADYPASLKREAAQFQLARSIVRQHRTWTHVRNHTWPAAPFMGTYVRLVVEREKPFDAARCLAALDVYEKEFPKGRYLADIRLLRGGVAVDAGDYPKALQLLEATLADQTHKELHLDAALALAQCFELLHDPAKRQPLARAIVSDPAVWRRFKIFTRSPTCGQRLRVYEGWVAGLKE